MAGSGESIWRVFYGARCSSAELRTFWDADAANPTILFDADFDGVRRKGITAVSKAGYLRFSTGVPLTPVVETPVPQDAIQKTAATQPIPQGDDTRGIAR